MRHLLAFTDRDADPIAFDLVLTAGGGATLELRPRGDELLHVLHSPPTGPAQATVALHAELSSLRLAVAAWEVIFCPRCAMGWHSLEVQLTPSSTQAASGAGLRMFQLGGGGRREVPSASGVTLHYDLLEMSARRLEVSGRVRHVDELTVASCTQGVGLDVDVTASWEYTGSTGRVCSHAVQAGVDESHTYALQVSGPIHIGPKSGEPTQS